jgi:hypothetical protein
VKPTGMKIIFTLCSNNYLAQALVLGKSVLLQQPNWKFVIGLVDRRHTDIAYNTFGCDVVEAAAVEPAMNLLAEKFSIVELNTCVKPRFFQYLFEQYQAEQVIYLDPDICTYSNMHEIDELFEKSGEFVITPHILTPLPLDGQTPEEPLFLNYGLYNLGFLALKKTAQTLSFLTWWKERTYLQGFDKPAVGLFTDQLWINLVPLYFSNVVILRHAGYNMAAWNLHERTMISETNVLHTDSTVPLVFFHFSSYNPGKQLLHKEYSRFQWHQRPDLHNLFDEYKAKLENENYHYYKNFSCYYVGVRQEYLRLQASIQQEQEAIRYASLPFRLKMIRKIKRLMPGGVKKMAIKLIRS